MAGLYWMAVTLAVLLSAGNSVTAVEENKLVEIVNLILNRFTPRKLNDDKIAPGYSKKNQIPPMFSLAVSIPYDKRTKKYDTSKVTDDGEEVKGKIVHCEVYTSKRMVAATVLKWRNVLYQCPKSPVHWPNVIDKCRRRVKKKVITWADVKSRCPDAVNHSQSDHAEYRTLQHFNTLVNGNNNKINKKQDLLLFYVRASPCPGRCTEEGGNLSILTSINQIKNWKNYAVVFSDIFKPRDGPGISEDDLRGALVRLGTFKGPKGPIGLDHIFRCNRQKCVSCGDDDRVTRYCISDNKSPDPMSSISFNQPRQGRSGQGVRGKQSKNIGGQDGSGPDVGRGSQKKKGRK